ncbi:hypothetical protein SAVCW2_19700 [Streptomyces avermitilis]|nr:hypothetical protein SAVCW2_19700 [Streptomyces avermitilis]
MRDGDENALPARGDVADVRVQERVLLVAVGPDWVHVSVSCRVSLRRMNFSQPLAARTRRVRLGAPGWGSGGVYVRPSATRFLRGGSEVVTRSLLSDGAAAGRR